MSELEAVIFDVDGTLVDSERDGHRVAFNAAFDEAGMSDQWDVETYGRLLRITGGGHRLTAWFVEQGQDEAEARELATRLHKRKTEIMRELVQGGLIRPRPGITKLIQDLQDHGVGLHVATTGTRAWVEPLLDRVFGDRFQTIVTGSEIPELKPSPAVYLEVLERTGLDPSRTVALEDSSNGVQSAVAAGLPVVVAYNEYTRDDDFTGAALVGDGPDDPALVAWFEQRMPTNGSTPT